MNKIDRIIVQNVLERFEAKKWTQRVLAKKAQVNHVALNKALNLKGSIGKNMVTSLAKALGCPEEDLYCSRPKAEPTVSELLKIIERLESERNKFVEIIDHLTKHPNKAEYVKDFLGTSEFAVKEREKIDEKAKRKKLRSEVS